MGEVGTPRRLLNSPDDDEAMLCRAFGTSHVAADLGAAKEAKEGTPSQVDRLKSEVDTIGEKSAS
jgi:hypothetical protein